MTGIPAASMEWLTFVINFVLKSSLIICAVFTYSFLFKKSSPAERSMVWSIAFVLILSLPLFELLPGKIDFFSGEEQGTEQTGSLINIQLPEEIVAGEASQVLPAAKKLVSGSDGEAASQEQNKFSILAVVQVLFLGIWVSGAGYLLIRYFLGYRGAFLLVEEAELIEDQEILQLFELEKRRLGVRSKVSVMVSNLEEIPFVSGFRKLVVMLPKAILNKDSETIKRTLIHELHHLKRNDLTGILLLNIATAISWFNPLVWKAVRSARLEMERACDDQVINSGSKPALYARDVLNLAMVFENSKIIKNEGMAMALKSSLEERVTRIVDSKAKRSKPGFLRKIMVSLAAIAILIPLMAANIAGSAKTYEGFQDSEALYENLKYFPQGNYNKFLHMDIGNISQNGIYKRYPEVNKIAGIYSELMSLPSTMQEGVISLTQGTGVKIKIVGKDNSSGDTKSPTSEDMKGKRRPRIAETHHMSMVGKRVFRMVNAGNLKMVVRYQDVMSVIKKGLNSGQLTEIGKTVLAGKKLYEAKDGKGFSLFLLAVDDNDIIVAESIAYLTEMADVVKGINTGFIGSEEFHELEKCSEKLGDVWMYESMNSSTKALLEHLRNSDAAQVDVEEVENRLLNGQQFMLKSYQLDKSLRILDLRCYLSDQAALRSFEIRQSRNLQPDSKTLLPFKVDSILEEEPEFTTKLDGDIYLQTVTLTEKEIKILATQWRDWQKGIEKKRAEKKKQN